ELRLCRLKDDEVGSLINDLALFNLARLEVDHVGASDPHGQKGKYKYRRREAADSGGSTCGLIHRADLLGVSETPTVHPAGAGEGERGQLQWNQTRSVCRRIGRRQPQMQNHPSPPTPSASSRARCVSVTS